MAGRVAVNVSQAPCVPSLHTATAAPRAGMDSPWRHTYEAFFGGEVCAGLRQGDDKAREHMFNMAWTHINKNKLSLSASAGGAAGMIVFDETLVRVMEPVLPLGTSRCNMNDLMSLLDKTMQRYLQLGLQ